MFWALFSFAAAILWTCMAFGFVSYDPWVVTMAFVIVALNCLVGGIKELMDT